MLAISGAFSEVPPAGIIISTAAFCSLLLLDVSHRPLRNRRWPGISRRFRIRSAKSVDEQLLGRIAGGGGGMPGVRRSTAMAGWGRLRDAMLLGIGLAGEPAERGRMSRFFFGLPFGSVFLPGMLRKARRR